MAHLATTPELTFNLYEELDAQLDAAYARNIAEGNITSEAATATNMEAVVKKALEQAGPDHDLAPEAERWAGREFATALRAWAPYRAKLSGALPADLETMLSSDPSKAETIQRQYDAKAALQATGLKTPEGLNAGETMHLRIMPWQSFKDNLHRLPDWIRELRQIQRVTTVDDFFNDTLLASLTSDQKIYRNPLEGQFFGTNATPASSWLSAREYLDQQIAIDGAYGTILVQTSNEAGCQDLAGKSPNTLTNNGQEHLQLGGYNVDGMGIFEWLALTLQEDPSQISGQDYSWLLANRIKDNDSSDLVPCGCWGLDRVRSNLGSAGYGDSVDRPRLAVI